MQGIESGRIASVLVILIRMQQMDINQKYGHVKVPSFHKIGLNGVFSDQNRENLAQMAPILHPFRKVGSLQKLSPKICTQIGRSQRYVYQKF